MAEFKEVYEQYAKKVYYYLLSLTKNVQEAEELVAETFYQAFLHIDRFEGRSSMFTWLCQIGKNAWLKECRRKKHFVEKEPEESRWSETGISPETLALKRERIMLMKQAVFQLEEPYREVFILRAFAELRFKEIAEKYEKTEEWARVTYYRAKSKVQKTLECMEK